jgi:hypothetical protein
MPSSQRHPYRLPDAAPARVSDYRARIARARLSWFAGWTALLSAVNRSSASPRERSRGRHRTYAPNTAVGHSSATPERQVGTARCARPVRRVVLSRRRSARRRRAGGDGGGGLHRVAVRRCGDRGRPVRGTHLAEPADTRRREPQASRQDRSPRRADAARVLAVRGPAGVVDPADRHVGVARTDAAPQVARRSARVDPAQPSQVVPVRRHRPRGGDPLDDVSLPAAERRRQ